MYNTPKKDLSSLYIQNHACKYPQGWDHSGKVVENYGFHSHIIKADRSDKVLWTTYTSLTYCITT